jgi:hypothetical protein
MGGPQSRSGRGGEEKNSPAPAGNRTLEPRSSSPLPSRYTDWVITDWIKTEHGELEFDTSVIGKNEAFWIHRTGITVPDLNEIVTYSDLLEPKACGLVFNYVSDRVSCA